MRMVQEWPVTFINMHGCNGPASRHRPNLPTIHFGNLEQGGGRMGVDTVIVPKLQKEGL